jgi:hypothetical protein
VIPAHSVGFCGGGTLSSAAMNGGQFSASSFHRCPPNLAPTGKQCSPGAPKIFSGLPSVRCVAALLLALLTVLSGCAANNPQSVRSSTNPTSTIATRTPASTTTAVAAPPPTQSPRTEKWTDLGVGDCLAQLPPTDPSVVTVTVVDCATAHAAEVYLRGPMAVDAAIADVADRQCAAGFSQYAGRSDKSFSGGSLAVTYLIDSDQDRTSDNPAPSTVICLLHATNGQPLTGSARR